MDPISHRRREAGARSSRLRAPLATVLMVLVGLTTHPPPAHAATVYLCKAYSGGLFWSDTVCSQRQALIDRMVSVPDGLPWAQQVALAEQSRTEAERLYAPPAGPATPGPHAVAKASHPGARPHHPAPVDRATTCRQIAQQIDQLDARARQPQSGPAQDHITERKRALRQRQAALRC